MSTAEILRLEAEYNTRAAAAQAIGDHAGSDAWKKAASLLLDAECASTVAAMHRSSQRKTRKLGLRITR